MANPNKTVARARRAMGGFPAKPPKISPLVEWLSEQARSGVSYLSMEEAEAAYAKASQLNGYIGFYERRRYEVKAETLLAAKEAVIAKIKKDFPRHGDRRIAAGVSVVLAELLGEPVVHHAVD